MVTGETEEKMRAELERGIDTQEEDMMFLHLQELFLGWSLNNAQEMRAFFNEHKGELFEEYEEELEVLFFEKFTRAKAKARRGAKSLETQFSERWAEQKWSLCNGKKVLQKLRDSGPYHFSDLDLIAAMQTCPPEIEAFWARCKEGEL